MSTSIYMSTLGFPVTTEQDFRHYAYETTEFGHKIETRNGSYTYWIIGNGIELWVQTNHHKRLLGMNPHFSGSTRMPVSITARLPRYERNILEGAFYAWATPQISNVETNLFPFVFDLPDYDVYDPLELPRSVTIQLAAFANNLQGFENEEAYMASPSGKTKLTSKSFIPSGLFTLRKGMRLPAQAQAVFSGQVLDTEMIINPVTMLKFYWARLNTLLGEIDLVADPQVVQGKIVKHGIIHGEFWLSGRIM